MARFQMVGMRKSQGGGCRVTLMEGGEPVLSCWAPTFPEAGQVLARMDDARRASMTAEQRRARHDAATHATRAR